MSTIISHAFTVTYKSNNKTSIKFILKKLQFLFVKAASKVQKNFCI